MSLNLAIQTLKGNLKAVESIASKPCNPDLQQALVDEANSYHEALNILSEPPATGPWHYRTDTGGEHGKVVEDAELPKGNEVRYLALVDSPHNRETIIYWSEGGWYIDCGTMDCGHGWLLKHLIAWAEIRK